MDAHGDFLELLTKVLQKEAADCLQALQASRQEEEVEEEEQLKQANDFGLVIKIEK